MSVMSDQLNRVLGQEKVHKPSDNQTNRVIGSLRESLAFSKTEFPVS